MTPLYHALATRAAKLDAALTSVHSALAAESLLPAALLPQHRFALFLAVAALWAGWSAARRLVLLSLLRWLRDALSTTPQLVVPRTPDETDATPRGRKWVRRRSRARGQGAVACAPLTRRRAAQDPSKPLPKDFIPCYDPATLELLGDGRAHVDSPEEARRAGRRARAV